MNNNPHIKLNSNLDAFIKEVLRITDKTGFLMAIRLDTEARITNVQNVNTQGNENAFRKLNNSVSRTTSKPSIKEAERKDSLKEIFLEFLKR